MVCTKRSEECVYCCDITLLAFPNVENKVHVLVGRVDARQVVITLDLPDASFVEGAFCL